MSNASGVVHATDWLSTYQACFHGKEIFLFWICFRFWFITFHIDPYWAEAVELYISFPLYSVNECAHTCTHIDLVIYANVVHTIHKDPNTRLTLSIRSYHVGFFPRLFYYFMVIVACRCCLRWEQMENKKIYNKQQWKRTRKTLASEILSVADFNRLVGEFMLIPLYTFYFYFHSSCLNWYRKECISHNFGN